MRTFRPNNKPSPLGEITMPSPILDYGNTGIYLPMEEPLPPAIDLTKTTTDLAITEQPKPVEKKSGLGILLGIAGLATVGLLYQTSKTKK